MLIPDMVDLCIGLEADCSSEKYRDAGGVDVCRRRTLITSIYIRVWRHICVNVNCANSVNGVIHIYQCEDFCDLKE